MEIKVKDKCKVKFYCWNGVEKIAIYQNAEVVNVYDSSFVVKIEHGELMALQNSEIGNNVIFQ